MVVLLIYAQYIPTFKHICTIFTKKKSSIFVSFSALGEIFSQTDLYPKVPTYITTTTTFAFSRENLNSALVSKVTLISVKRG